MKYVIIIVALLVNCPSISGQKRDIFVFDTGTNNKHHVDPYYYSKTDFSFTDTLSFWSYNLDTTYKGDKSNTVKPIARLTFWRTKSIDDGISARLYNQLWAPRMVFEIYTISALNFCYRSSVATRVASSCRPPDVGGDIIVMGKFVLLNHDPCVSCVRYDTQIDYCRPIVNRIFKQVDMAKITSLMSLVSQFPVKEGSFNGKEVR